MKILKDLFEDLFEVDFDEKLIYICINIAKVCGYLLVIVTKIVDCSTFILILSNLILLSLMALYVTEYVLDFFNKRTDNQPFIQKYATTVFKLINTFIFSLLLINFLFNCKNTEKVYIYYFNILFAVDIINCSISNSYLFKHNLIYLCVIVVFSFILYSFENYFCLISVVPLIVNVISILNLIKDESDSKTNKMSIISSLICSISILIVMFTFLSPTEFSFNICVKKNTFRDILLNF